MSLYRNWHLFSILAVLVVGHHAKATEPNESFAEATVLAPGVMSVSDDLTPGFTSYPDTVLGTRGLFGDIEFYNDDDSPLGDGRASGLGGVPTNSGSIDFAISGYPDEFFEGGHGESGEYEVFVDVYDFFNDLIDSFSEVRTLQPGFVDEYSFSDFEWIDGSYDVYIDNTVGGASAADVDFFTFTGLSAGASFTAEVTQEVLSEFDSYLGWFSDTGVLLDTDDDDGVEFLSLLEGTVPASGKLTFAVTGYGDDDFLGDHIEDAAYSLELSLGSVSTPGDFDGDGDVDGRDFLAWQRGNSPSPLSAGDLAEWQANYGNGSLVAAVAVPEPNSLLLGVCVMACRLLGRCSSIYPRTLNSLSSH